MYLEFTYYRLLHEAQHFDASTATYVNFFIRTDPKTRTGTYFAIGNAGATYRFETLDELWEFTYKLSKAGYEPWRPRLCAWWKGYERRERTLYRCLLPNPTAEPLATRELYEFINS